eukprot:m.62862 g.62862  ORF g.62862 m.62862 type:complete len:417 (-) comp8117_c0_seq2:35-1285(-)
MAASGGSRGTGSRLAVSVSAGGGANRALSTPAIGTSHLLVPPASTAARPSHKPAPAIDVDRTRVRKDAQLFLSSISLGGPGTPMGPKPREGIQEAGPAEAEQPRRAVAVQTLQRIRAARPAYLHQSRISLTGLAGVPFFTYSVHPFSRAAETRRRQEEKTYAEGVGLGLVGPLRATAGTRRKKKRGGRKGTRSYEAALEKTAARVVMDDILDAPEIGQGKHQKVLKMPSYTVTLILYVKPEELKKDLNEMWAEKHPDVLITLSKFRSIKREMVEMGVLTAGLEVGTVALAHVYFEQLVASGRVGKPNRKFVAAACLVLATKFWESKDDVRDGLQALFRALQDQWQMSSAEIIAYEFPVYAELNFDLHVAASLALSRMERVIDELPEDHPDVNIAAMWRKDPHKLALAAAVPRSLTV